MKIVNYILGASLLITSISFAQEGEEDRECKRMRKIANDAMSIKDYKEAVIFFIKGESICGNYDAANYGRLTGSLGRVINSEKDKTVRKQYCDTILAVYDRMESIGLYDTKNDMIRAYYQREKSSPDFVQADIFFTRGIKNGGVAVKEMYIPLYYYNTYTLFYMEQNAEKKSALKKRMISDFFMLSELITNAKMSIKSQESITSYFNTVVQSCDDLTPEIEGFIATLSKDPDAAKSALMSLITLMESKKCTESQEYLDLINKFLEIDPESSMALEMKVKILARQGKVSQAVSIYRKLKEGAASTEAKQEYQFAIADIQFRKGMYKAAYSSAMAVSGVNKGKALVIAAQCVGQTANSCGASTFDRKCNNLYAVQLLEQSGSASASLIQKYKNACPTADDCFKNNSPKSITLECWGVTVYPCK